jgi:hypothetical protein
MMTGAALGGLMGAAVGESKIPDALIQVRLIARILYVSTNDDTRCLDAGDNDCKDTLCVQK